MRQHLFHVGHPQLAVELTDLGFAGNELMVEALNAAFTEVRPEDHQTDPKPEGRPAYIFVWDSVLFETKMYLKFKLMGTRAKPVLWLYSCHPAYFG